VRENKLRDSNPRDYDLHPLRPDLILSFSPPIILTSNHSHTSNHRFAHRFAHHIAHHIALDPVQVRSGDRTRPDR
jgi:hypothetical protein